LARNSRSTVIASGYAYGDQIGGLARHHTRQLRGPDRPARRIRVCHWRCADPPPLTTAVLGKYAKAVGSAAQALRS
jgi:hypothetical protein